MEQTPRRDVFLITIIFTSLSLGLTLSRQTYKHPEWFLPQEGITPPSQNMLEEWLAHCIPPENTKILLPVYVFTNREWDIAVISWLVIPNPHYTASTQFKKDYTALWLMNYSPRRNSYPAIEIFPVFDYSYRYYYRECSDKLHSLVPPVETFTSMPCCVLFTVPNHSHSLHVP